MRRSKYALLTMLLLPFVAWGGQINGTLQQNGAAVVGKSIHIRCGVNIIQSATTNSLGAFSFYIPPIGICAFEVEGLGLSHKVYSDHDPVRYDFEMVEQPDGRYLLRRR